MQKPKINFLLNWILLLLISSTIASAQEIKWQNTIGGNSSDVLSSVKQTFDGGFILGGWSISGLSGDKTENSMGGSDYWVVKTDALGSIMWQNTIGGSLDDRLGVVVVTSDGGYLLGGTSNSGITGDKSESSYGSDDIWLVKIDSTGIIQWQNTIGGSDVDALYSMQSTMDGGYILGCNSKSGVSGDKSEPLIGIRDYWIVKIDSIGNVIWENTIGGSSDDKLNSIQQTFDGGFIIGGVSNSNISGDKTEDSWANTQDYWLVKTDSVGNLEWQNTIGGVNYDELITVNQTADGGYILGGRSESNANGNKTEGHIGAGPDYWIVKTNHHGFIQWQNAIGGNGQDDIRNIHFTADGGYLLVGHSYSNYYADKDEDNRGHHWPDLWILKIDSIGNIIWQNSLGGKKYDLIYSSTLAADGSLILGAISDSRKSGDKNEDSNGGYDFWLVKLTDQFNNITGKIYLDLNANQVQDSGEPSLTNRKILQNTQRFAFSNSSGTYKVAVIDTGYFKVYGPTIPDFITVPTFHSANFSSFNQIDSLNDFAIQPNGSVQNLKLSMVALPNFRTWMTSNYYLYYENAGNNLAVADVVFFPDSSLDIFIVSPTPTVVTQDSIVWSGLSLMPFTHGSISIQVQPKSGITIGSPINAMARIEPMLNDNSPSDNIAYDSSFVVGSYDPNDIIVDQNLITPGQLADTVWLEYIIRFQNTGNDTAFNIRIVDYINRTLLEPSSFEFISSSHPVEIAWVNFKEEMIFTCNNILLPDSNVNEPMSHGYIRYRIRPDASLVVGDEILNYANIYFDYNPAIRTNNAITLISNPTGIASANSTRGKLHVFPNPTENTLNISGIQLENGKAQLRLMDIYGKLILEKTLTSNSVTLETNHLSSGIYLIQSGELRGTFVKQ